MSQVSATSRKLLKAVATGDGETARTLAGGLDGEGHAELNIYATAVLSIVLDLRFPAGSSPESIRRFVNELRYEFRDTQPPVKPFMMEGVIRAFLGEEHILEEIPPVDQLDVQYPVIRKIVAQSEELRDRFDRVLDEAELLMQHWAGETA